MLGYLFLGIPCGVLSAAAGMSAFQVLLLSAIFYSGTGQFILPNMMLAGATLPATIASIVLVSSRQILYSAGLVKYVGHESFKDRFAASWNVTDESFGVSIAKFQTETWTAKDVALLNLFCQSSWTASAVLGTFLAGLIDIPTAIPSFAMTSIFICLLFTQRVTTPNVICALSAVFGVLLSKTLGLSGLAIFIGALVGIAFGMLAHRFGEKREQELQVED